MEVPPLGDNILYAAAALVPLILSGCLYVFARRRRTAKAAATWRQVILGNGLVVLLLLSIVFLIGESYYRFVYYATDSYSQTRTSQRWFDRHFQYNNAQVRDSVDYVFTRRSTRPRFTLMGDSFTEGWMAPREAAFLTFCASSSTATDQSTSHKSSASRRRRP
mgnify:CR=1 FL=1